MNRKTKLLRLLALAMMKVEDVVGAVGYRLRASAMSTLADELDAVEGELYDEAMAYEDGPDREWGLRVHDWVYQDNTDTYNALANELEMEEA